MSLKKPLFCLAMLFTNLTHAGSFYLYPSALLQSITAEDSSYRGVSPRLGVGYGTILGQSFFLAGEAGAMVGTAILSNNIGDTGISLRVNRAYDFSLLPGMLFSEGTMGYLRLGVSSSNFTGPNEKVTGGILGVGLQLNVINCWFIRGEYFYTAYGPVSDLGNPVSDTFALGVVYTFK